MRLAPSLHHRRAAAWGQIGVCGMLVYTGALALLALEVVKELGAPLPPGYFDPAGACLCLPTPPSPDGEGPDPLFDAPLLRLDRGGATLDGQRVDVDPVSTLAERPAGWSTVAERPAGWSTVAERPAGWSTVAERPAGWSTVAERPAAWASLRAKAALWGQVQPGRPFPGLGLVAFYGAPSSSRGLAALEAFERAGYREVAVVFSRVATVPRPLLGPLRVRRDSAAWVLLRPREGAVIIAPAAFADADAWAAAVVAARRAGRDVVFRGP